MRAARAWAGASSRSVVVRGAQLHRLAVGRIDIGAAPFLLAMTDLGGIGHALVGAQPLERVETMVKIGIELRRIASRRRDLPPEGGGPFAPRDGAALRQMHRQRECGRLPGLLEYRPVALGGQRRKAAGAAAGAGLGADPIELGHQPASGAVIRRAPDS